MRILQVNNFEELGGGSDRVFQLTTNMLLERGHEVATLACGTTPFNNQKSTYLLPRNGYFALNPFRTLTNIRNFVSRPETADMFDRIVEEFRPEVVHLHIFYGQISSSILERIKHHGIPCVMTVHEYRMICPVSTLFKEEKGVCEDCAGKKYHNAVLGRCNRGSVAASMLSALECIVRDSKFDYLSHIDYFFMVSKFCRDKHIEYLPQIAEKSSVLYNFVNIDHRNTYAEKSNPAPIRGRYLYCGRLSKEKGVDFLCDVFMSRPDDILHIAGDGPLRDELRAKYSGCKNIKFLGKLNSNDLKDEISQAWFTIVPSEWYENNPMSVLESFAQGVPVLGADIGGVSELVLDGGTGYLFKPSNKASLVSALEKSTAVVDELYGAGARPA
jgi:glycosyltransferase involved in cell wall biosynthesis